MDSGGLPALELAFPGPERDSGVAAILAGRKTALTGLLQILEHAAEPVPEPGQARRHAQGSEAAPSAQSFCRPVWPRPRCLAPAPERQARARAIHRSP